MSPCVICQHPDRIPERGQVCEPDRARLAADLAELPELIAEATTLTLPAPAPHVAYRYVGAKLGCANRIPLTAHTVTSGPTGSPGRVRVTGTRTAPLPISVELLNLIGPGSASVSDPHGDQIGELPPRWWLLTVSEDWAEQLGYTLRARTTVAALVRWLSNHLDWACDHHPAVDDFAAELRRQRGILRNAAGLVPAKPEPCDGVACPKCDLRALYRAPGSGLIHCGTCPHLMTPQEYDDAVREQAKRLTRSACRPSMIVSH